MTEVVRAWDYWPKPPLGRIYKFHYSDAGPEPDTTVKGAMPDFHSWFVWDDKLENLLYFDFDKDLKWKDTWYLKYKLGFGISEWKDENLVEGNTWTTKIFGHTNKIVFQDSNPIWWGDVCELGKKYENYPKSDFFACSPPQAVNGTQSFVYEKKLSKHTLKDGVAFNDVVTCVYQQSFGKKTAGARYWFVKGIGPISVQWIARDDKGNIVITNRMDADLRIENGFAKDIQT
jgi:hypothetical protein